MVLVALSDEDKKNEAKGSCVDLSQSSVDKFGSSGMRHKEVLHGNSLERLGNLGNLAKSEENCLNPLWKVELVYQKTVDEWPNGSV